MNGMMIYLLVGIGGAAGAVARFSVSGWVNRGATSGFPWGTLTVNILGCLALGFAGTLLAEKTGAVPTALRSAIAVGFLGSFTTFSTFAFEKHQLIGSGSHGLAILYATASFALGLMMVRLGVEAAILLGGR